MEDAVSRQNRLISDFDVANARKQGAVDAECIEAEKASMFQELEQKDTSSVAQSATLSSAGEGLRDMVAVIRCRDCKHGQQVGGYGVLCEYGLEELRPMDHFCAWGEVRNFGPEDNEEE